MSNKDTQGLTADAIDESLENQQEPENLAEATTAALDDDALGGHATEDDVKK